MVHSRRSARENAVLILYAQLQTTMPLGEVMQQVRILLKKLELGLGPDQSLPPGALTADPRYSLFLRDLVLRTIRDTDFIDKVIAERALKWDLKRIALLDRVILRIGIAEMLHFPDIPEKVSINEAIEIAKKYSTENSSKFINGILDSVKKDLESLRQVLAES